MADNYLPASDTEYSAWLANFNTVAQANAAALGLSATALTPSVAAKTALDASVSQFTAAQAAAKSATQGKLTARQSSEAIVRALARAIQANPAVSNGLKESLGVTVRQGPVGRIIPVTPSGLLVLGQSNGVNVLKWDGTGNKPGVVYVIEAKCGATGAWQYAGLSKRLKFEHAGCTPGQQAMYRVKASRGEFISGWSNEAVIYGAG